MEWISTIVDSGNNILWTYILIILLLAAGLYFSFGTKFVQIRLFPEMFRLIVEKEGDSGFLRSKPLPLALLHVSEQGILQGSLSHWCRWTWCSILDVDNRDFRDGHCLH